MGIYVSLRLETLTRVSGHVLSFLQKPKNGSLEQAAFPDHRRSLKCSSCSVLAEETG